MKENQTILEKVTMLSYEHGTRNLPHGRRKSGYFINLEVSEEQHAHIVDKMLYDMNSNFTPSWAKGASEKGKYYINLYSKFEIPLYIDGNKHSLDDVIDKGFILDGATIDIIVTMKTDETSKAIYPAYVNLLTSGKPFNPFDR